MRSFKFSQWCRMRGIYTFYLCSAAHPRSVFSVFIKSNNWICAKHDLCVFWKWTTLICDHSLSCGGSLARLLSRKLFKTHESYVMRRTKPHKANLRMTALAAGVESNDLSSVMSLRRISLEEILRSRMWRLLFRSWSTSSFHSKACSCSFKIQYDSWNKYWRQQYFNKLCFALSYVSYSTSKSQLKNQIKPKIVLPILKWQKSEWGAYELQFAFVL